jgi:hypothetical protein
MVSMVLRGLIKGVYTILYVHHRILLSYYLIILVECLRILHAKRCFTILVHLRESKDFHDV